MKETGIILPVSKGEVLRKKWGNKWKQWEANVIKYIGRDNIWPSDGI